MKLVAKIAANIFDRFNDVLAAVAAGILAFLMLSVAYSVVLRYAFDSSVTGLFEVWEYAILYLPFLGGAWLLRKEGHVVMDVLISRMKPKGQATLIIITSVVGSLTCLALAWYGTRLTWASFHAGYVITEGEIYPPEYLVLMVIPLGFWLLFIEFLRRTHRYSRSKQMKLPTEHGLG